MPTYNFDCATCGTEEAYVHSFRDEYSCSKCGGPTEKVWSLGSGATGHQSYPYTTTHITGQPLTITDAAHERAVCREYGVTQRADAAFLTKEHAGVEYDIKTGKSKVKYREGSGLGMPGCWV